MRIAHVSDCYLPRLGGIEVQVTELTKRQAAAGDAVHVITATPGHEIRSGVEELSGVTVHRVTARMPFELPVHPRTRANVAPVLREIGPDVVHVHLGVVSPFAWGGIRAALDIGLPVLVTVHSVWGAGSRAGYGAVDRLGRVTARGVQLAAVSSMAAGRIAAAVGADVLVTPNGVDPQDWNPEGRVLARPEQSPAAVQFVTAMRLAPRKRALPLLRMFAAARGAAAPRPLRLQIAGDGPQRNRLQSYVDQHGLTGDVALLGRLSRPELRELYVRSDVFVQPSVKESFGLAALEARATGLPILARAQTGLTEFVTDEIDGLLAADDADLARSMARIALADDLRLRITRHNVEVPPAQTWSRVLAGVADAYATAIARRHSAA